MNKDEYSPFKIVHHTDRINDLREGKQPIPLQVQIVPANVCNQNCVFCAYRMDGYNSNETFNDKEMMSFEKIIESLNCMAEMGVKAIQYTGGGEPLVHPRIKEIFQHTLDLGLDLGLVTNGMGLDEELCDILSESSWVRISIDASSAEDYSMIRKTSLKAYERVKQNVRNLVEVNKTSIIGIGYVMNRENYLGVLDCANMAKELGADNFRISAAFTPKGHEYFDGILEEGQRLSAEAQSLSDDDFTVFNLFGDRIKDNFEGEQDYDTCPIKDLQVYLGADYNLYTCCTLAYNKKGLIGSIKDQTFTELWNSEAKQKLYSAHNPRHQCKFPCMYKNKNEFINYCVADSPKHINFI